MFPALSPLLYLPLLELIDFIEIGPRLGFALTLLWLIGSTMLGFSLLKASARTMMGQDQKAEKDGGQPLFDGLCLLIAGFLFLFPGFISDFIAIPFLIPVFRHWLYAKTGNNPDNFVHKFAKEAERFRPKTSAGPKPNPTVIEGEFKRLDDTEPPQQP